MSRDCKVSIGELRKACGLNIDEAEKMLTALGGHYGYLQPEKKDHWFAPVDNLLYNKETSLKLINTVIDGVHTVCYGGIPAWLRPPSDRFVDKVELVEREDSCMPYLRFHIKPGEEEDYKIVHEAWCREQMEIAMGFAFGTPPAFEGTTYELHRVGEPTIKRYLQRSPTSPPTPFVKEIVDYYAPLLDAARNESGDPFYSEFLGNENGMHIYAIERAFTSALIDTATVGRGAAIVYLDNKGIRPTSRTKHIASESVWDNHLEEHKARLLLEKEGATTEVKKAWEAKIKELKEIASTAKKQKNRKLPKEIKEYRILYTVYHASQGKTYSEIAGGLEGLSENSKSTVSYLLRGFKDEIKGQNPEEWLAEKYDLPPLPPQG